MPQFLWCFLRITCRGQFTVYFSSQHNLTWISLFADRTQNVDRIIVCHIPGEEYVMLHCSGSISLVHLPKFSQRTFVLLAVLWVLCLSKVQTELCLIPKEKHSIPDKMFKFILGRGQAIIHGEGQTGKSILFRTPATYGLPFQPAQCKVHACSCLKSAWISFMEFWKVCNLQLEIPKGVSTM